MPLRGGKGWLYEGGIREPLIVRWPAVLKAERVIDTPVSSPDFFPTLLDAAGAKPAADQKLDGLSLLPLLRGESLSDRALCWHYPHYGNQGGAPGAAIRRGEWKLIEWFEDSRVELFHLGHDLGEQTNLAAQQPERVRQLTDELHVWQKEVGAVLPTRNESHDPLQPNGRAANRPADNPNKNATK